MDSNERNTLITTIQGHVSRGEYDPVRKLCAVLLQADPNDPDGLKWDAIAAANVGLHDEAEQSLRRLIERRPDHVEARHILARVLIMQQRTEEALGYYNRYIELDPGNVQVRMTIAGEIATTGDYVSAYEVLAPVMEEAEYQDDPEFQTFLFSLATAAGQRVSGEQGEAAARPYFETAASISADDIERMIDCWWA